MRIKWYWWFILGGVALTLLALSFWLFSGPSTCEPRQDDPEGYLLKICVYIQEKQINVSPADPTRYQIKRIEEREENGRPVLWVFLNCCYLGDIAVIDKATGEVINFEVGAQ
jgi:hypothetical protein